MLSPFVVSTTSHLPPLFSVDTSIALASMAVTICRLIILSCSITDRYTCRFGEFEKFIYDFLVGSAGSSGGSMRSGGEGLRLKLQTPLFVADALMEAARVRLQGEIAAAEGELAALEAVKRQLAKFKVRL
jgi:hypothetical protein